MLKISPDSNCSPIQREALDRLRRNYGSIDYFPARFGGGLGNVMWIAYLSELATLGQCVEHAWMAPDLYSQVVCTTPTSPAATT